MKNFTLVIPILISLSIVGCCMNNNQLPSDNVIHQASLNIDKLINTNYQDIEKSFGTPYYATYYIDADKLKNENINSISIEDLKEDVSLLASYKDPKSNNSYLHVYYEDGIVKDVIYGPYKIDNLENLVSTSNISNADYKVTFYKNHGAINSNNFVMDTVKKGFVGKSIEDFNKAYNLKSANFIASTINESDILYFYPLVNYNIVNKEEYNHPNLIEIITNLYNNYDGNQPVIVADKNLMEANELKSVNTNAPYVADKLIAAMQKNGAYLIKGEQVDKLVKTCLIEKDGKYTINKKWVGKDASLFLKAIGVEADARLVIAEVPNDHPFVYEEMMMPVLGIVRVKNIDEAMSVVNNYLRQGLEDMSLVSITKTKIVEVI